MALSSEPTEIVLRPENPLSLAQLREVWASRGLLFMLVERDVRVRYKQAVLGVAWALLQPAVQTVLFTVLFNRFAGIGSDSSIPYPWFCAANLVVWSVFSSGLSHASESLIGNGHLVSKVYFPRVILPMAGVGSAVVDFLISYAVLIAVLWWAGFVPHGMLLLGPLVALVAVAWALALGLWTSALNLQFRDVRHALPFFFQLLLFVTPVFYPVSMFERWRWLLVFNPMTPVVNGFRACVFGQPLPWLELMRAVALALAVGLVGFFRFRGLERTFADRL
jgi:lipopolysaccharide transport system permease protein